jgi:hypothetical protein
MGLVADVADQDGLVGTRLQGHPVEGGGEPFAEASP